MNQRQTAIARATMFRDGKRTIDSDGTERTHDTISGAKRHSRSHGVGKCVAQQRGEDLFALMRERIAKAEAAAAEEQEAA